MESSELPHQGHCATNSVPQLGRKLRIALIALVAVFVLSFLEPLAPLNERLVTYLSVIWWAVLLGFLVGGLIDYFVPNHFLVRYLGPQQPFSLVYALIAGFAMSACSHGILAIAMQLYKKGAGVPAVLTFLLASPWANLPMTILLFGLFGWNALWFVGGALLIALVTGLVFSLLDQYGWIERARTVDQSAQAGSDRLSSFELKNAARRVFAGAVSLANMVGWWIILGVLIAAVIGAFVPGHLFMEYVGPDWTGLSVTLLLATVVEVCSEGSSPIAFELFEQVGKLGNPFVFLMAGVVTDYTEIGLIWSNIGRRSAIWLPLVAVPQVLAAGWFLNTL